MDAPTRNDVLASNLLFVTLAILLVEHLYGWIMPGPHLNVEMLPAGAPWWRVLALLSFSFLLRVALYYGVRRGLLFAKLLLVIGFAAWIYKGTDWQQGYVAGVSFVQFTGWSLLALMRNLLTLVALVLIFRKSLAPAPNGT